MAYSLRSIITGSSAYTAAHALTQATGFFLIPIYTRVLTTDDYGIISVLGVVVAIGTALLSMGVYAPQVRYYHEFRDEARRAGEFLFAINALVLGVGVSVSLLLTGFGEPLFRLLIRDEAVVFVPFVVISIWNALLGTVNQLVPSYLVATKQFFGGAALQVARFIITVSLIILFVVGRREGALGSIKGVLIGHVVAFVAFYWVYARHFVLRLRRADIRNILSMGLPVMVHGTALAVMVSVDKLILKAFLPLSSVGIYNLGHKFGLVMSVIVLSVNRAWMPNYYELMDHPAIDREAEIRRVFAVWLTVIGTLCVFGGAVSKDVVRIATGADYHGAWIVVPVILIAYFFQGIYFFVGGPIFFFKRTLYLPFITVCVAGVNIALNLLLIPRLGIMGAAASSAISFALLALVTYLVSRRLYDPEVRSRSAPFLLITVVAGLTLAGRFTDMPLGNAAGKCGGLCALLCIVVYRRTLVPLLRKAVNLVRR